MNYMERELARALRLWRAREALLDPGEEPTAERDSVPLRAGDTPRADAAPYGAEEGRFREAEDVSAGTAATEPGRTGTLSHSGGEARLISEPGDRREAEELSERLERDARRYDGAFLRER